VVEESVVDGTRNQILLTPKMAKLDIRIPLLLKLQDEV
jgi:hypothetical protein